MRTLLFLDIDGVLNTFDYIKSGKGYIDPSKISLLNTLSGKGIEIVICSSWGYTQDTLSALHNLKLPIIGGIEDEAMYGDWVCRGNLVEKWLIENIHEPYEYYILDDSPDYLFRQEDNLIHVNENIGLTQEDINKIRWK